MICYTCEPPGVVCRTTARVLGCMKTAILFLSSFPAYGQLFSFGIVGGGLATRRARPCGAEYLDGKRYTRGLTAEESCPCRGSPGKWMRLIQHTRPARTADCAFTSCFASEVRADIFEFPVLAKYRLLNTPRRRHLSRRVWRISGCAVDPARRRAGAPARSFPMK